MLLSFGLLVPANLGLCLSKLHHVSGTKRQREAFGVVCKSAVRQCTRKRVWTECGEREERVSVCERERSCARESDRARARHRSRDIDREA